MKNTFVISDLHFYHNNIIKLCNRPYKDLNEMHSALIKNWNSVVTKEDEVYILGDFSFGNIEDTETILKSLNGTKYLIKGNHDAYIDKKFFNKALFENIYDYLELKIDGKFVVMCHYPLVEWNGKFRGSINLYGHTHRKLENEQNNQYCVCADVNDFTPQPIKNYLTSPKIYDII